MKLGVGRFDWDPTLERLIGVVRLAVGVVTHAIAGRRARTARPSDDDDPRLDRP